MSFGKVFHIVAHRDDPAEVTLPCASRFEPGQSFVIEWKKTGIVVKQERYVCVARKTDDGEILHRWKLST
jgi:hypothetical protein